MAKGKRSCAWHRSDNHSDDLLEVYYGSPEPVFLCGYHESRSKGRYSEIKALGAPGEFVVDELADEADAAFAADERERYEDLNEQIRTLADRYPRLVPQAEARGVIGGGPLKGTN